MNRLAQNTALIVIDVQEGIDDPVHGRRNNPQAEENIARLLLVWRQGKLPLIHIQHLSREPNSPLRPDQPGVAIKALVRPLDDELLIRKHVNSAFIGTGLEEHLRDSGVNTVVITGLTTDHCVSATARMAGDLGFHTYVVSDATATFERAGPDGVLYSAEVVHGVSLASLEREFATVIDTDTVLRMAVHDGDPVAPARASSGDSEITPLRC